MAWNGFTASSNVKDPENRSRKSCVCGGHSARDVKKNLNHHATLSRLRLRAKRKLAEKKRNQLVQPDPPPRYDDVFYEGLNWLNSL